MINNCSQCGSPVKEGYKFCSLCGAQVPGPVQPNAVSGGTMPYSTYTGIEGRALRVLTGKQSGRFYSIFPSVSIGRSAADIIIEDDSTISHVHARVFCDNDSVYLEDLNSLNGVFFRVKDKVTLNHNDIIQAGRSFFLFENIEADEFVDSSGTEFYASPQRGERFRLTEIIGKGLRGCVLTAPDTGITIGRSEGKFIFANDVYMNPLHFSIRWIQRGAVLIDHDSVNGTFVQLHDVTPLKSGDEFFVGRTLFTLV